MTTNMKPNFDNNTTCALIRKRTLSIKLELYYNILRLLNAAMC